MAQPTAGVTTDVMVGTMYINYKQSGWSEKYIIGNSGGNTPDPPSYANAVTAMQLGVKYRSCLLGNACQIVWARVSLYSKFRDAVGCCDTPVDPVDLATESGTVPTINEPADGLWFRVEDQAGYYSQRILRGVRDAWIADFKFDFGTLFPTAPVPTDTYTAVVAGTITAVQAIKNFWLWVEQYTLGAKRTRKNPLSFTTFLHNKVNFRYVGKRDTGRPFALQRGRAPASK